MPNISTTLNGIDQSVSRPIIIDIIDQLQDITKISKDTKILFPGTVDIMLQPGSSIDDSDRSAEFLDNHFLQILVTEDYQREALGTQVLAGNEHIPIFYDQALGVMIKPSYTTVDVTINFRYRTFSKIEAKRWRDDVFMRYSLMRDMNTHRIRYSYAFPSKFTELLTAIYTLRENVSGYGDTFTEYFLANASNKFTSVSNLTGSNSSLSIAETQERIYGQFDFQGAPEPEEKDNVNSSWVVTFAYKFTYERPTMCNMKYPVMIHNQLLDAKYVTLNNTSDDSTKVNEARTVSFAALKRFEGPYDYISYINPDPIIMIPDHDEFIPAVPLSKTGTILFALCEVESDLMTLLNLNQLGDIILDQDILDFISNSEFSYVTKQYQSVLQLSLYSNDNVNPSNTLSCDYNLNVKAIKPLDLRVNNRVRLSIVVDIQMLPDAAITRLKQYPKAFVKIISAMNETLANFPGLKALINTRKITDVNFNNIFRMISNVPINNNSSYVRQTPYVPRSNNSNGVFTYVTPAIQNTTVLNDLINYGNVNDVTIMAYNPLDIFSTLSNEAINNLSNAVSRTNSTVMNTSILASLRS